VEGLVTAAVVSFVWKARPEVLERAAEPRPLAYPPIRNVLIGLLAVAAITGGALSWFASSHPDGLEWSMFHTSGKEELQTPEKGPYAFLGWLQKKTAILPGYTFKASGSEEPAEKEGSEKETSWPAIDAGGSFSGILGATLTMVLVALIGLVLRRSRRKS
jgi:cobalt/nickel transport system permease protein